MVRDERRSRYTFFKLLVLNEVLTIFIEVSCYEFLEENFFGLFALLNDVAFRICDIDEGGLVLERHVQESELTEG